MQIIKSLYRKNELEDLFGEYCLSMKKDINDDEDLVMTDLEMLNFLINE